MAKMWVVGKVSEELHEFVKAQASACGMKIGDFVRVTMEWYKQQEMQDIDDFGVVYEGLKQLEKRQQERSH